MCGLLDYIGAQCGGGSGHLIKGILWCGDVTADRLKWGNDVLKNRFKTGSKAEVSPEMLKRIKRVKRVTKMTEKVAVGVLSGAVKVSGFFTCKYQSRKKVLSPPAWGNGSFHSWWI